MYLSLYHSWKTGIMINYTCILFKLIKNTKKNIICLKFLNQKYVLQLFLIVFLEFILNFPNTDYGIYLRFKFHNFPLRFFFAYGKA